jgi:hypothetical protein
MATDHAPDRFGTLGARAAAAGSTRHGPSEQAAALADSVSPVVPGTRPWEEGRRG